MAVCARGNAIQSLRRSWLCFKRLRLRLLGHTPPTHTRALLVPPGRVQALRSEATKMETGGRIKLRDIAGREFFVPALRAGL